MPSVFLGLGSNIHPERNLQTAAGLLRQLWPDIRFSSVYRSAPIGKTDQADFWNAVGMMDNVEPPDWILQKLEQIEKKLGKKITERFGPRTIDLDLLLYGGDIVQTGSVIVPHPRMHERRFVLKPLLELLSDNERHPRLGKSWAELLDQTDGQECERVAGIRL